MTTPDHVLMIGFVDALSRRDRPRLVSHLQADVRMCALLPSRSLDVSGPDAVVMTLLGWFSDVPEIVVLDAEVDLVGDVWHAGYRFGLAGSGIERVVEQHMYCMIQDGSIATIRLICSGFRPASTPTTIVDDLPAPRPEQPPAEMASIDALGQGCASLTPRISAAIRALAPGDVLSVLTDDPSAHGDIASWSRLTGHMIVASTQEEHGTRYYLRRA